ncbi:hypothetical protein L1987_44719 [Smallanthus sonchifolius]|uniref:Uncharacterized protein n=1 Tax=Smallanthus sonchifolius TaxID=185202 RepID=A0ACB9GRC1_9ASTR|nr:hypothetical protein L1987_44719 [Smallanthus sonchifolius]
MEDEQKNQNNTDLETARADRSVWLMKCPVVVAKSWNSIPPDSQQNLAKVVVSLDPLRPEDPSSLQLFERQPNWALKQLVIETDQPAQLLKVILNELCVYNKHGTNQGTYELKPEYKKSVEDTGAE